MGGDSLSVFPSHHSRHPSIISPILLTGHDTASPPRGGLHQPRVRPPPSPSPRGSGAALKKSRVPPPPQGGHAAPTTLDQTVNKCYVNRHSCSECGHRRRLRVVVARAAVVPVRDVIGPSSCAQLWLPAACGTATPPSGSGDSPPRETPSGLACERHNNKIFYYDRCLPSPQDTTTNTTITSFPSRHARLAFSSPRVRHHAGISA
ncbi:hypothetical protein E2C01_015036 [Portunus trituberculatus]|uniref:Uncharacterized protein n=1 Tax=Portunus trituberculatus TaxID=210409 RepID=A0A5B7DKL4_PORTR|nr:hypothetical protein [Portunus trituberculatus]